MFRDDGWKNFFSVGNSNHSQFIHNPVISTDNIGACSSAAARHSKGLRSAVEHKEVGSMAHRIEILQKSIEIELYEFNGTSSES